jgi:hypothetical protein
LPPAVFWVRPEFVATSERSRARRVARLIGAHGGPQDAPVLIDGLYICTIEIVENQVRGRPPRWPEEAANAIAFEAALQKVTGVKPDKNDALGLYQFWLDLWENNAASTVTEANEPKG